jgi:hypothetical protein
MVKHIVLFKLKDNSIENCLKAKEVLLSMEGKVPELRSIEVGVDFLHSDRSYDLALIVTVDNKEALESYQRDPYHCQVVKPHMHAVRSGSVALDFEF